MPTKRKPPAKKKQRSSAPAQHIVVDRAQVTVSGLAYEKFKGWVPLFTGIAAGGAAIAFIWNAWTWIGLPKVVVDSTFHESLSKVQADFVSKLGQTKEVVIKHSDSNTAVVKEDVGKVAKQVETLVEGQKRADVRMLETQQRQLFLQRSNLLNSISSVELQLRDRPNDQFLTTRKAELEAIKSTVDRETDAVNDQIRRARSQ
jgi:hypothetical protein